MFNCLVHVKVFTILVTLDLQSIHFGVCCWILSVVLSLDCTYLPHITMIQYPLWKWQFEYDIASLHVTFGHALFKLFCHYINTMVNVRNIRYRSNFVSLMGQQDVDLEWGFTYNI